MASKRATILQYLKDTLLPGICTDSGYNFDLATVERGHRNPRTMGDHEFPAVFITATQERRKNLTANQFMADPLQVVLVGYVKNSKDSADASGTGAQEDLDKLIEDITKALETDRLQGDRVKWTEITDIATDEGDLSPVAGCVISVSFTYVSEGVNP